MEKEFGISGEETSVGVGADLPALVFLIDLGKSAAEYGLMALVALRAGKEITETVTFCMEWAKKIKRYVTGHHTYLEREDAYPLAVNAVVEHLGRMPKSIVFEGYMVGDWTGGGWDHLVSVTEIGEPPQNPGAWVPHHFQFNLDGKKVSRLSWRAMG